MNESVTSTSSNILRLNSPSPDKVRGSKEQLHEKLKHLTHYLLLHIVSRCI